MPLRHLMTATATTLRATTNPSTGKKGDPSNYLTSVRVTPPMLPSAQGQHAIRDLIGLQGSSGQIFEIYTESHTHTKSGSPATELPDITEGDLITISGITYYIQWSEPNSATSSFGETLLIYATKDKR